MKRFTLVLIVLMTVALLFTSCSSSSGKSGDSGSATSASVAHPVEDTPSADDDYDRDITVVQALDLVSWDPVNTSDLWNGYIINNVYVKLFTFDDQINGIPELCKEYKRISDTEWHFTIYTGVKNHDGTTLTIDDVVHSLNRTKNGTAIGALFGPVLEITKVNEDTLSITTDGPYPALPTALTHQACCIVPKHYSDVADADNWTNPIGSGRYKFQSRAIGDNVKLIRFDDYYDQENRALNKSLTFKIIPEGSNRTIAVETNAADLNIDFNTIDYDRVVSNPNLKLWGIESQSVWHLGMDTTHQWFGNKLVRQAVNFAIDRESALQMGHNGHGTVMYNCSTIAPTCLGAIVNPLDMYSYNPEKAKELMAEAGCPGFNTQIVVFSDERERIAQVVQANLAEIGINAEIKRIESSVFAATIADHNAPMFITSWGAYWDPDLFLARRFSKAGIGGVNRGHYLNPDLDVLIQEGRSSFDNNVRAKTYEKIQEFMAVEAPEADLYVSIMFALANKDLKGVSINVERPYNFYKLHY